MVAARVGDLDFVTPPVGDANSRPCVSKLWTEHDQPAPFKGLPVLNPSGWLARAAASEEVHTLVDYNVRFKLARVFDSAHHRMLPSCSGGPTVGGEIGEWPDRRLAAPAPDLDPATVVGPLLDFEGEGGI